MLSVPYFEKALYELPEEEVTAQRILALADEVEARIEGGPAPRPLMRCSGWGRASAWSRLAMHAAAGVRNFVKGSGAAGTLHPCRERLANAAGWLTGPLLQPPPTLAASQRAAHPVRRELCLLSLLRTRWQGFSFDGSFPDHFSFGGINRGASASISCPAVGEREGCRAPARAPFPSMRSSI